jgi:hypothetical protein
LAARVRAAQQGVAADELRRSAFGLPLALAAERRYVRRTDERTGFAVCATNLDIGCYQDAMTSAAEVAAAVDEDLANLQDPRVLASIKAFRVTPPTSIRLRWDYGKPDETFDGWLVFSDPGHRTGIVYCDQGFGPRNPWGLIATRETSPSMGMDSGWFGRFIDAYWDCFSATDLPIWKVIRRNKDRSSRTPVTQEISWEEAWSIVYRLRKEDPAHEYDCEHDISH